MRVGFSFFFTRFTFFKSGIDSGVGTRGREGQLSAVGFLYTGSLFVPSGAFAMIRENQREHHGGATGAFKTHSPSFAFPVCSY